MDDKTIMENLLLTTKGVCDLYMHGTIESAGTSNVHSTFKTALTDALSMQGDIYKTMTDKGWYQTQNAEPNKLTEVKNKYSCTNCTFRWFKRASEDIPEALFVIENHAIVAWFKRG